MIFPIGQYQGAMAEGGHQVRRGEVTERLDDADFAAWGLGHGPADPVLAAGLQWTRKELVRYAGMAGLAEAEARVADLLARGLLAEAPATGSRAVSFARAHRAVPLGVGLGNSPDATDQFTIGRYDQPLVQVDEAQYDVWCWSAVYDSVWQACQARSGDQAGADPGKLLSHFLGGVHRMAAANTLYLDVVARS